MTPQERALLENFLTQLVQVRNVNKDPEAERLIYGAVEQQPDAAYLLVQRALLLSQGLEQAKARIAALEEAGRGQGFLDPNASGWGDPSGPSSSSGPGGNRGQGAPGPGYGAGFGDVRSGGPGYGAGSGGVPSGGPASGARGPGSVPVYGAPGYGNAGAGAPPANPAYGAAPAYPTYGAPPYPTYAPAYPTYGAPAGGGFSSFLGQAAATAAGVAGGEFLFQGMENLFGHHGGGGFGEGNFGGGFGGGNFGGGGFEAAPTEDVTINNYYAPEEVIVENDFNQPAPDDPDTSFTSDDFSSDELADDQDVV